MSKRPDDREKHDRLIAFLANDLAMPAGDLHKVREILNYPPEIYKTVHSIGAAISDHFHLNRKCSYDCEHMDQHIREWRMTIQSAKPGPGFNHQTIKAFRRVLVEGERDW